MIFEICITLSFISADFIVFELRQKIDKCCLNVIVFIWKHEIASNANYVSGNAK
jgi:hypothetical protein